MPVPWTAEQHARVEAGIACYPVASGRCAALARIVFAVGVDSDDATRGRQIVPRSAARYVVPKFSPTPRWGSHTFVETHEHAVDALTGSAGSPSDAYLQAHWEYPDALHVRDVDVHAVDPGIQDAL